MEKIFLCLSFVFLAVSVPASWYWPFESSEEEQPRLSELVRNASDMISEASDLASDGKISEAVEEYRKALVEIQRVADEHPELGEGAVGGTLKTKRAYVEAMIDALLLRQVRDNAKSVAVSDTTELERRLAAEKAKETREKAGAEKPAAERVKPVARRKAAHKKALPARALTPREEVMKAIAEADYEKADRMIVALLDERPNDAAALNLRAANEAAQNKFREAEKTLDVAIQSNPRDYHAFYNMALLKLQTREDDKDGARRYYETGRALNGPQDKEIEELLK